MENLVISVFNTESEAYQSFADLKAFRQTQTTKVAQIALVKNENGHIVEKERYAKEGVHKGMDGIICDPRKVNDTWLVSFDQYGDLPEIACISVEEEDLKVILEVK